MTRVLLLKNKTTPVDPYEVQLQAAGYHPTFIPLLEHIHVAKPLVVEYLVSEPFLLVDAFIITSQRAVECLNECVALVPLAQRRLILAKPAFTVGPATAEILAAAGFTTVLGGIDAGNGGVLAELILNSGVFQKHRVVFFTGEIRKDIVPRRLAEAGFIVEERVIYKTYERQDIVETFVGAYGKNASPESGPMWIVFFSPQGTDYIVNHLQAALPPTVRLASIGPTTEQYLRERGLAPHVVAAKPHAPSLVCALGTLKEPV